MLWIRLYFLSKLTNAYAEVLQFIAVIRPPDSLEQSPMRNDLARMGDEII